MTPPVHVRHERPSDIPAIEALHLVCFPGPLEAQLVARLRDAGRLTISLVAEIEEKIVGHIAFSPVTAGDHVGIGLAPIGVLEVCRRRGIGGRLVAEGLAAARRLPFGYAVVLGEPSFYGRHGFQPASQFGLSDEYGGGEAFQALELRPGGIPLTAGLVRYAPEFAIFAED